MDSGMILAHEVDLWPERLLSLLDDHRSVLADMEIALAQKQDALLMMAPDALLHCDATLTMLAKRHQQLEQDRQALMTAFIQELGLEEKLESPLTLSGVSDILAKCFPQQDFALRLHHLKQTISRQAARIQQVQDHQKNLLKITRQWIAGASAFYQDLLAQVLQTATGETGYARSSGKTAFATQPVFQAPFNTRDEVI